MRTVPVGKLLLIGALLIGVSGAPASALARTAPSSHQLTEAQAGKTVTVHRGDRVVLTLHSTYWTIAAAHGAALRTLGPQQTTPRPKGCVPGQGCGTVTRSFSAVATGNGYLSATRTTCGEAMHCSPAQSRYRVYLRVVR